MLGIDIGANLIKAVEVRKEGSALELVKYAYAPSFKESLLSDSEDDRKSYALKLKEFITSSSFSSLEVVASLPESLVFTRVIEVPKMQPKEVEQAVYWEAEQYIPTSIEDVSISFQILPSSNAFDGKTEVLLVAAPKSLVKNFVDILQKANLIPLGLEPESMAIARSICHLESNHPETLIINVGAESSTISILVDKYIRFARSISTGGVSLLRALSQEFGIDAKQAEEYLKSYGMDETKMDGKIKSCIEPVFNVILNEVRKSIAFYENKKEPNKVKRVVLSGGTSGMPGILIYTGQYLGIEVLKVNPWKNLSVPVKFNAKELSDLGPMFSAAIGLVLKEV